ncbi:VWA domain-containing protein [Nocardioides eburneiflavus]|uniref:VWA domain-containing protein n=1 Tax=Nocardioides eburneiflavus TaxID=2518372 RepID=A0A4Z1CB83_9ACTN|nr:VWA domain-containing protein [Nocardioides eburneiflavus]TGN62645.1 VWA domain-containing protein [Nocardioides eburneiflavus]
MTFRPGARLAGRPLHFIFLLDASGSMSVDGKIDALNQAIRDALPHLRELASQNPFVEIMVRAVAFSDGARWHIADPSPIHDVSWPPVVAGGYTDLGAALVKVAEVLTVPPMEARAFPPVLVVVSDGRPTDDFEAGLDRLMAEPWGRRAVRLAIAIGADADLDVLARFIGDPDIPPFTANDPEQLAYLVRFVSTAASQLASSPAGAESSRVIPAPDVPVAADGSLLVW